MSRTVITDIVIPVVSKILADAGFPGLYGQVEVRDENLEEYLEEEMRRLFGVIGADRCQHLKEQLEEAKKNDPFAFEHLLKQLLTKYVKMQIMLRQARDKKDESVDPPDRFAEQRRRYNMLLELQRRRMEEC
nr:hypothetical protein [Candidatus Njordarchaeum guaymaensis]